MRLRLTRLWLIGVLPLYLMGCATPLVPADVVVVPRTLLQECLALPVAADPTTNGELVESFITAREGHSTCRGTAQVVQDFFGEEN